MAKLSKQYLLQQKALDVSVKDFVTGLSKIMRKSQAAILQGINQSNYLERLGQLIQEMERLGLTKELKKLERAYAEQFAIAKTSLEKAYPKQAAEASYKSVVTASQIQALVNAEMAEVKSSILNNVDGIKAVIQEQIIVGQTDVGKLEDLAAANDMNAETLTRTSLMTFYRTSTVIEAKALGLELFEYMGQLDDATRPFCEELLTERKPPIYSLDEILAMPEQQGLSVLVSGGGYNCRHSWIPITEEKALELGWKP